MRKRGRALAVQKSDVLETLPPADSQALTIAQLPYAKYCGKRTGAIEEDRRLIDNGGGDSANATRDTTRTGERTKGTVGNNNKER